MGDSELKWKEIEFESGVFYIGQVGIGKELPSGFGVMRFTQQDQMFFGYYTVDEGSPTDFRGWATWRFKEWESDRVYTLLTGYQVNRKWSDDKPKIEIKEIGEGKAIFTWSGHEAKENKRYYQ